MLSLNGKFCQNQQQQQQQQHPAPININRRDLKEVLFLLMAIFYIKTSNVWMKYPLKVKTRESDNYRNSYLPPNNLSNINWSRGISVLISCWIVYLLQTIAPKALIGFGAIYSSSSPRYDNEQPINKLT
uniref:Uncharacterized protein n=1 Tax=Trichobilharzia regenti TaxID=157069 RepID=A0AA85K949_TRIRE|nr:unnamed protein product [Trichobilharzia regenti]